MLVPLIVLFLARIHAEINSFASLATSSCVIHRRSPCLSPKSGGTRSRRLISCLALTNPRENVTTSIAEVIHGWIIALTLSSIYQRVGLSFSRSCQEKKRQMEIPTLHRVSHEM